MLFQQLQQSQNTKNLQTNQPLLFSAIQQKNHEITQPKLVADQLMKNMEQEGRIKTNRRSRTRIILPPHVQRTKPQLQGVLKNPTAHQLRELVTMNNKASQNAYIETKMFSKEASSDSIVIPPTPIFSGTKTTNKKFRNELFCFQTDYESRNVHHFFTNLSRERLQVITGRYATLLFKLFSLEAKDSENNFCSQEKLLELLQQFVFFQQRKKVAFRQISQNCSVVSPFPTKKYSTFLISPLHYLHHLHHRLFLRTSYKYPSFTTVSTTRAVTNSFSTNFCPSKRQTNYPFKVDEYNSAVSPS
jgi:hypothetical protein